MSETSETGDDLMARGIAAFDEVDLKAAADAFRGALSAGADPVKCWTNLGVALNGLGRAHAAEVCLGRAIDADPDSAESWGGRATARRMLGDYSGAEEDARRAAALDPSEWRYPRELGRIAYEAARPADAVAAFDAAIASGAPEAQLAFDRGVALLQLERYAEGWPGYERRFELGALTHRGYDAPLWTGDALEGRRLVIQAEQGLGDRLQFARYIPAALDRANGEVWIETHPALRRLFSASFPTARFFEDGEDRPAHDVRIPATSLPAVLNLGPADGWRDGGCLTAPDGPAAAGSGFRVGLVWRGGQTLWNRSCPLRLLLPLAGLPGVRLYSLQRGGGEEIAALGAEALIEDAAAAHEDFADDAAFARGLDLIISVDTSTAHFGGAIGAPVWTLLTHRTAPTGASRLPGIGRPGIRRCACSGCAARTTGPRAWPMSAPRLRRRFRGRVAAALKRSAQTKPARSLNQTSIE